MHTRSSRIQALFIYCSALVVGATMITAFAPYQLWPLALITPAILLFLIEHYPERAYRICYSFAIGYFSAGSWVFHSLYQHTNIGLIPSVCATLLFIAILSVSFLLLPVIINTLPGYTWQRRFIYFPCAWVFVEWLRTLTPFAYPWLLIAYTQSNSPLTELYTYIGFWGLTATIIGIASVGYHLRTTKRGLLAYLVAIAILFMGLKYQSYTAPGTRNLHVILVQNNTGIHDKWRVDNIDKQLRLYTDLVNRQQINSFLMVTPECAIPYVPQSGQPAYQALVKALENKGSLLQMGTFSKDDRHMYNSNHFIGTQDHWQHKQKLVAFGEYTPNSWLLQKVRQWFDFPESNLQPGPVDNRTILFKNIKLTALICYEIAFPSFVEKRAEHADILVVTSDDLWFGHSNAMHQHQQIAAFYAHALHKPTLFVNNNGATAVISSNGDIIQTLEANTFGIIETNIHV